MRISDPVGKFLAPILCGFPPTSAFPTLRDFLAPTSGEFPAHPFWPRIV